MLQDGENEPMHAWMIILGFLALFGIVTAIAAVNAKRRRQAFVRLAVERGWQFVDEGGEYARALSHLPLFSKGRRRRAYNVLHGGQGEEEFWLFDYQYTIGSGKHSSTHRQTIVGFPRLNADLPSFELRPESVFHKIGAAFGYQDIDLPMHASFSSRFLLRGRETSAIRELFDAELVRAVEAERSRCIEGEGSAFIVYRYREKVNTDRIVETLEQAMRLRDAFVQRASRGFAVTTTPTFGPVPV